MKNIKIKNPIRKLFLLVCLGIFSFSSFKLVEYYIQTVQQNKISEEIQIAINVPEKITENVEWKPDFKKLKEINPEVVGYIFYPDTRINYPVVWKKGNNDYYLNVGINNSWTLGGSIFVDGMNEHGDLTDRITTLYGHNMFNNTMFGDIKKFNNKEYFENNSVFYYFTEDGKKYKGEVFIYNRTDVWSPWYEGRESVKTDEDLLKYIQGLPRTYSKDMKLEKNDKVILISTCTDSYGDNRTVMLARMVDITDKKLDIKPDDNKKE